MSQLGNELTKAINSAEIEMKAKANKAIRKAAIKTWSKIIRMTPVDTGRARGNWFIGLSVDSDINTSDNVRGSQYVNDKLPNNVLNDKVYLYNNLPYIGALEFGHSSQAPNGMVRISLLGWPGELKKAFKEV